MDYLSARPPYLGNTCIGPPLLTRISISLTTIIAVFTASIYVYVNVITCVMLCSVDILLCFFETGLCKSACFL